MADNPPVNPIDQAGMEAALANQERIRKSTDLPLFHAMKEKDVCTAELFIERFELAAEIARWILPVGQANRYARTCREFQLLLRGNALKWWASLDNCLDFDKTNWVAVKARFLESYAKHYTPTSACTGLAEMKQKPGENVQDYFVRCNEIYNRIKEIQPAGLQNWRGALPDGIANNVALNLGKRQGTKEMGLFFLHILFVAGLREDIRMKTMEQNDMDLEAARLTAKRVELLLLDKRQQKVLAMKGKAPSEDEDHSDEDTWSEGDLEDLTEEECLQLNAIRVRQGKKPFRGKRNNRPFRDLSEILCHYCNKKGHYQKVCRKRIKEKGAMVFKKTNNIGETEEPTKEATEEPAASTMSISDFYRCNALRNLN
jgi:Retrotransposon gag protein